MQEYKKALYRQQKDDLKSEEEDDTSAESKATKPTEKNKRNDKKQQSKKKSKEEEEEQQQETSRPSKVDSSTAVDVGEVLSISAMIDVAPCSQPVVRRISKDYKSAVTSGVSIMPTTWPSVGQLSLPLPSYHNTYHPEACYADVDDEAIWQMWTSCDEEKNSL